MRRVDHPLDGHVDVFHADLDAQVPLGHLLSPEERSWATRLRRPHHRARYVAGRGLLRSLLAERLDIDPRRVPLGTGAHGKPCLTDDSDPAFSIAHSGGDLLITLTSAGEIGVDLEQPRCIDPLRLAVSCFSSIERDELLRLEPSTQLDAFFDGWVRKEAISKADGRGLSLDFQSFSVTLRKPARVIAAPGGDSPSRWVLTELHLRPGLPAAFALRGSDIP